MVGLGNLRCQYQEVSIVALIVGINSGLSTGQNHEFTQMKTLAARGLEEPWNFQELLTESVGRVHFS